jgi:very-short-patch-repair endonuclease
MSDDQSGLFSAYWSMLAPDDAPALVGEYHFNAGTRHRFDWAVPSAMVAVEVDGGQYAYRGGKHATDTDRWKLNRAAELGWRVFRFSPQQLNGDPIYCVNQVARAIGLTVEETA